MKKIRLGNGMMAIVDDDDYDWLSAKKWQVYVVRNSDLCYARREVFLDGRSTYNIMHRLIFEKHNGYLPRLIDHKDGNGLNNTKDNLRDCTISQNCHNRRGKKKGLPHGVTFRKDTHRYRVSIMINGNAIHIGHFDNVKDAENAFINASLKYYGEFSPFYND